MIYYSYIIRLSGLNLCSTALQIIVPVPNSVSNTFTVTAIVGDTAVLPCPISPGALLQSYSVRWIKDAVLIVSTMNLQNIMRTDPKYDVDGAYSLVIHSVSMNDSSSNYQCMLYSTNPNTDARTEVQPNHDILLSLNILGMYCFILVCRKNA